MPLRDRANAAAATTRTSAANHKTHLGGPIGALLALLAIAILHLA